jgi:hypothetical protein
MIDVAFFTQDGYLTVLYNEYETPVNSNTANLCGNPTATSILGSKSMFPAYPYT